MIAKNRERKKQHLFIIEGARELTLALSGDYKIQSVFVCPEIFTKTEYTGILEKLQVQTELYEVTGGVFEKLSYRENSDGLIALAIPKNHQLDDLLLPDNPFIIILESVEKPGNLGAVLRTADAAAVDAVIVCDPLADLYNPNVIRSGVGCLFTVQTAVSNSKEVFDWLKNNNIRSFAAELQALNWYQDTDFTIPSAIVLGTEADGLSDFWLQHADKRIKIPMRGKIDSLNVSVSAAILTFEAMRQRGF